MTKGARTDLIQSMEWRSPQTLRRYGLLAADQRARAAHKRLGLGGLISINAGQSLFDMLIGWALFHFRYPFLVPSKLFHA